MAKKYGGFGLSVIVLLVLLLTGCGARFPNETIIISGNEANEQTHQDLSPVQVKKIYRLPEEKVDKGYWLGWSTIDTLLGSFKSTGFPERFMLKQLTLPFEQSKDIMQNDVDHSLMSLSPDGRHVADVRINKTTITTVFISASDGKEKEVDTFNPKGQSYLQNMSWSDNSQMIGYLVLDAAESEKNSLRVYDTKTKASKSYTLNEFNSDDTLLDVQVSNDGRSALIKLLDTRQSGRPTIALGKLIDGHFETKYKRQIADKPMIWIGDDQFAFWVEMIRCTNTISGTVSFPLFWREYLHLNFHRTKNLLHIRCKMKMLFMWGKCKAEMCFITSPFTVVYCR